jgi:hypothetical protein
MYRVALLTSFILLAAAAFAAEPDRRGEQGVTGKVLKLSGNFQPQATLEGEAPPPARGAKATLIVPVHVFKGSVEPFTKPNPKHPKLVTIAKPDKAGVYRVPLAPGEYTVVAEIDGKLYLNLMTFDAATKKAAWATVPVKAKVWSQWNIEDTSDAAF